MQDYRLDQREDPRRHRIVIDRLTGPRRNAPVDYSGGELPGRKSMSAANSAPATSCEVLHS
jgi:hypothetical protein